jgi:hypothetical protein
MTGERRCTSDRSAHAPPLGETRSDTGAGPHGHAPSQGGATGEHGARQREARRGRQTPEGRVGAGAAAASGNGRSQATPSPQPLAAAGGGRRETPQTEGPRGLVGGEVSPSRADAPASTREDEAAQGRHPEGEAGPGGPRTWRKAGDARQARASSARGVTRGAAEPTHRPTVGGVQDGTDALRRGGDVGRADAAPETGAGIETPTAWSGRTGQPDTETTQAGATMSTLQDQQRTAVEVRAERTREGVERQPRAVCRTERIEEVRVGRVREDRAPGHTTREGRLRRWSPGTGKPRSATGARSRQRGGRATDAGAEQGLEVGPAGMPAHDEGARSGGDVATAAHAGNALEGRHRQGGTRPSGSRRATGCTRHGAGRNPMNPRVGSRMQQACTRPERASRRGGERPRGRNTHGVWQHRAEVGGDAGGRHLSGEERRRGGI